MDFEKLAQHSGEWLRGIGPESDIVVSSRIRLARNLAEFPFIARATDADRAEVERILSERVETLQSEGRLSDGLFYIDVSDLEDLDRQFLVERQLISREHAETDGARAVVIDGSEQFSVMINEEDHLRIQVMRSGLDLESAWESINALDDLLEEQVTYAYSDKLGYLTACPTNVGTGARVSVMLHLPALVITRQIDKVFRSLQKINLAVRGLYGEGSQAMGDFYQISNQVTLGMSEQELTKKVSDVVPVLLGLRTPGPRLPDPREPRDAARPRRPRVRHLAHRAADHQRRDAAPAFQRADGREPGPDPRRGDPHRQQALRPHPARPPAEARRDGA